MSNDFTPNSHKYKEEQRVKQQSEKRAEKVVRGSVKTKKKSDISKFKDVFITEDLNSVKSFLLTDVFIPKAKNLVVDIITDGINMLFFGGTRGGNRGSTASKVSYSNYYNDKNRNYGYSSDSRTRNTLDYDNIIFDNRGDAEEVLSRLDEMMSAYDFVRVADLYDLAGISCDYTYNDYGWSNIRNAKVVRVRDGYRIEMPRALPIKR